MEVTSAEFMRQKMESIHMNPVRAGWVSEPEHWLYSSATNYSGLPSLIEIDFIN